MYAYCVFNVDQNKENEAREITIRVCFCVIFPSAMKGNGAVLYMVI